MAEKSRYTFYVGVQVTDFRKRLSLTSLANFILTTAGQHADANGFGVSDLQANQYTWVLSRLMVEMHEMPLESQEISIDTWIESVEKFFTTRNFTILNSKGDIIGHATSSWAVIDMATRRPLPLDKLPNMQRFIVNDQTPLGEPQRLPDTQGEVRDHFRVKYSDVDVNVHANSLHYIKWLSDCFSLDFYRHHTIKRFEINFLKELVYGEQGEVWAEMKAPEDYYFQLITPDKGSVCRARIVFNLHKDCVKP